MIDLYSFGTPNGQKAAIMLEEVGLEYKLHKINILEGDQDTDEYIAISPYSKIPAIVDHNTESGPPYPVFESGAILMYLAEKTGQLMPAEMQARYEVIQWLMFQMGGLGPMLGQAHHFLKFGPERIPYAMERYTKEANRLYRVLNRRLAGSGVSYRRLFDRRHRHVPVDSVLGMAGRGYGRIPPCRALVPRRGCATGGPARPRSAEVARVERDPR